MKALAYHGIKDVRIDRMDEPTLIAPRDAIVQVTLTTICGSDLHLYNGYIPTVEKGDVLGHEFVGRVVALGSDVDTLRIGDRVVVPFSIACGRCWYCRRGETSFCDNSNPNAWMAEKFYGYSAAGLFGYSHLLGGYAGGQAEYVRVPYADFGPMKIPDSVTDEQAIFLADIFPTGYMAAENAEIKAGDIVAVWGCGPVGQFAMKSAYLLGAERVIGIDRIPSRLEMARTEVGAETIDFEKVDVIHALHEMTGGRGPDACIDCVGLESHAHTVDAVSDKLKEKAKLVTDRPHALRQAIQTCGKGGVVSVPGVYGGFVDTFPLGALFGKGLKIRTGQTHVQKYLPHLMGLIESRRIDPTFVVTHRGSLSEAPKFYDTFVKKDDGMMKVLLTP